MVRHKKAEILLLRLMLFNIHFILSLQDWFAFLGDGQSNYNFTITGEATFPNIGISTAYDNYGFCQVLYFHIITVGHFHLRGDVVEF